MIGADTVLEFCSTIRGVCSVLMAWTRALRKATPYHLVTALSAAQENFFTLVGKNTGSELERVTPLTSGASRL